MTTKFESFEKAKEAAATIIGVNPDNFVENLDLWAGVGAELSLLNSDRISKELKDCIEERLKEQRGFSVKDKNGLMFYVVIGPFCNGFECWISRDGCNSDRI